MEEWSPSLFQDPNLFAKEKESYEYKLFETNLLNFICFEYALNRIEARVLDLEDTIQKVADCARLSLFIFKSTSY